MGSKDFYWLLGDALYERKLYRQTVACNPSMNHAQIYVSTIKQTHILITYWETSCVLLPNKELTVPRLQKIYGL